MDDARIAQLFGIGLALLLSAALLLYAFAISADERNASQQVTSAAAQAGKAGQ